VEFIINDCPMLKFGGFMTMGKIGDPESFKSMEKLKADTMEKFKS
jgi:hypothetical protein